MTSNQLQIQLAARRLLEGRRARRIPTIAPERPAETSPPPAGVSPSSRCLGDDANLADELRAMMLGSGLTRHQIAKRAGLSYSILHKLAAGKGDICVSTASRIAAAIGLRLTLTPTEGVH